MENNIEDIPDEMVSPDFLDNDKNSVLKRVDATEAAKSGSVPDVSLIHITAYLKNSSNKVDLANQNSILTNP